jgi:ribonuclease P protein component
MEPSRAGNRYCGAVGWAVANGDDVVMERAVAQRTTAAASTGASGEAERDAAVRGGHPAGFGRERRIRTSREYADVRRRGRAVSGTLLTVVYAPAVSPDVQPAVAARVGIVVGKRVGNAVTRNRVRRRVRERLRRMWPALAPNWEMIIIGRPAAAEASSANLARELVDLLRRARVLPACTEAGDA